MVVRLALAPWTARLTLAIGVLFPSLLAPEATPQRPSIRRTLRRSLAATSTSRPRRRLRPGVFFSSRWFSLVCRRTSLPVLVTRKRRVAPRWLFILGTGSPGVHVARAAALPGAGGAPLAPPWVWGGENAVIMLRPSWRAGLSPWPGSTRSVASRSSSRRPSSVWAIS